MAKTAPAVERLSTLANPPKEVLALLKRLDDKVELCERTMQVPLTLWHDEKSDAFYTACHLTGKTLVALADLEAVLDPQESEDYKLNRELYTDNYAYRLMESDAKNGRSFEDIVAEFDESYRPKSPLKIFGGQHRIRAIREAVTEKGGRPHGVRVYLGLSVEQKVDIATANNTSIAISNDLLDRMQEELLGTQLRDWSQKVGLLEADQGFADRRDSAGKPTVRIARTLVVNFHEGQKHQQGIPEPYVCSSGPRKDEQYEALRPSIKWNDPKFVQAGKEFTRLHQAQREAVLTRDNNSYLEFANKCMHPSVAAAWAYVAGMLQGDPQALSNHYALGGIEKGDPVNASALSKARLKGVDPDTYRGLGARINANELGRMVQLFHLQATKASKRGISSTLANAAIQTYEALRATDAAAKATKGI
ncbi:MAG TPA: hypothetical protein VFS30_09325 [Dehalococcoidia bacterium]|nr:hypothetical protein [Dehalococcoidia bacterium]